MPFPHDEELRLLASPVPTHTTSGFFCHSATAPTDATASFSNTALQVVPRFPVLNSSPVPSPMKKVAGRFYTTAKSEKRPPQFAGPTERHAGSLSSSGSSATAGTAAFPLAFAAEAAGLAGFALFAAPARGAGAALEVGVIENVSAATHAPAV